MKQNIVGISVLILSIFLAHYSYRYLYGELLFVGAFISGMSLGMLLMLVRLNVKNNTLKSYKRELEKESISSGESTAKVKVLESKIKVLEKALSRALKE